MSTISPKARYAGSIMAALFLKRFVAKAKRFAHLDIFGWVPREQPGRPQGGEPQAARALFRSFDKELGTCEQTASASIRAAMRYREDLAANRCADRVRPSLRRRASSARSWRPRCRSAGSRVSTRLLDTEALAGETVTLYDEGDGWAWVQLDRDRYVGYMPSDGLCPNIVATHA